MDPQVALYEMLEALRDGNTNEAATMAEDLAEWLRKGGFAPQVEMERPGFAAPDERGSVMMVYRSVENYSDPSMRTDK